jgi:ribosomal protein L7Ae-like RNA K-turn-binding protein
MSQLAENLQEELNIQTALQSVINTSRNHDAAKFGASDVVRALYTNTPLQLIVLPEDLLDEYKTIITAKAQEMNIPIVKVESRAELAKLMPFKAKKIGAVGITDFIYESREKAFIFSAPQ